MVIFRFILSIYISIYPYIYHHPSIYQSGAPSFCLPICVSSYLCSVITDLIIYLFFSPIYLTTNLPTYQSIFDFQTQNLATTCNNPVQILFAYFGKPLRKHILPSLLPFQQYPQNKPR